MLFVYFILLLLTMAVYEASREHKINKKLVDDLMEERQKEKDIHSLKEANERIVELERNLSQRDEFVRNIQLMFLDGNDDPSSLKKYGVEGDNMNDLIPELLEELTVYKAMVEKLASLDYNEHKKTQRSIFRKISENVKAAATEPAKPPTPVNEIQ